MIREELDKKTCFKMRKVGLSQRKQQNTKEYPNVGEFVWKKNGKE
jgi:hypothetical protein